MGFMGRTESRIKNNQMGARDFIWLACLGTAARAPAGLDDICRAMDVITLGQWLPVGELITASVDEMVRGGHMTATGEAGSWRVSLSGRGRETLSFLLAQPIARPASVFGQVGLRMKLAFLDLVDQGERRCHLDALICSYEDELALRQSPCEQCPSRGSFGELWRSHDLERLRRDVALLRSMAGLALGAPATRH